MTEEESYAAIAVGGSPMKEELESKTPITMTMTMEDEVEEVEDEYSLRGWIVVDEDARSLVSLLSATSLSVRKSRSNKKKTKKKKKEKSKTTKTKSAVKTKTTQEKRPPMEPPAELRRSRSESALQGKELQVLSTLTVHGNSTSTSFCDFLPAKPVTLDHELPKHSLKCSPEVSKDTPKQKSSHKRIHDSSKPKPSTGSTRSRKKKIDQEAEIGTPTTSNSNSNSTPTHKSKNKKKNKSCPSSEEQGPTDIGKALETSPTPRRRASKMAKASSTMQISLSSIAHKKSPKSSGQKKGKIKKATKDALLPLEDEMRMEDTNLSLLVTLPDKPHVESSDQLIVSQAPSVSPIPKPLQRRHKSMMPELSVSEIPLNEEGLARSPMPEAPQRKFQSMIVAPTTGEDSIQGDISITASKERGTKSPRKAKTSKIDRSKSPKRQFKSIIHEMPAEISSIVDQGQPTYRKSQSCPETPVVDNNMIILKKLDSVSQDPSSPFSPSSVHVPAESKGKMGLARLLQTKIRSIIMVKRLLRTNTCHDISDSDKKEKVEHPTEHTNSQSSLQIIPEELKARPMRLKPSRMMSRAVSLNNIFPAGKDRPGNNSKSPSFRRRQL